MVWPKRGITLYVASAGSVAPEIAGFRAVLDARGFHDGSQKHPTRAIYRIPAEHVASVFQTAVLLGVKNWWYWRDGIGAGNMVNDGRTLEEVLEELN